MQTLAEAAQTDKLARPDAAKLARIGRQGKHPGNTHRDLLLLLLLLSGSHSVVTSALTPKIPIRLKFKTITRTVS